jgi:hypothetical protein
MELSADGTARDGVRARRKQRLAQARAQRRGGAVPDQFQTPEWLERSFVLPLADRGVTVPSQSQPHHDDFAGAPVTGRPAYAAATNRSVNPTFVRPPSPEIDFARMVKRSDWCRKASRAAAASMGLAGLAIIIFLLTKDPLPLEAAIACSVIAVVALGVRVRLGTAPVPHVER